jgi:RNA binding exosome subunit
MKTLKKIKIPKYKIRGNKKSKHKTKKLRKGGAWGWKRNQKQLEKDYNVLDCNTSLSIVPDDNDSKLVKGIYKKCKHIYDRLENEFPEGLIKNVKNQIDKRNEFYEYSDIFTIKTPDILFYLINNNNTINALQNPIINVLNIDKNPKSSERYIFKSYNWDFILEQGDINYEDFCLSVGLMNVKNEQTLENVYAESFERKSRLIVIENKIPIIDTKMDRSKEAFNQLQHIVSQYPNESMLIDSLNTRIMVNKDLFSSCFFSSNGILNNFCDVENMYSNICNLGIRQKNISIDSDYDIKNINKNYLTIMEQIIPDFFPKTYLMLDLDTMEMKNVSLIEMKIYEFFIGYIYQIISYNIEINKVYVISYFIWFIDDNTAINIEKSCPFVWKGFLKNIYESYKRPNMKDIDESNYF